MATLHIVRGLPGSGKSTFAKKLAAQLGCKHFEADMFFTDKDGNYKFDRDLIGDAHEWCRDSVHHELAEGRDVVVSNTFTTEREITAYIYPDAFSDDVLGNPISIYEMLGAYGSIHNVPPETMDRMKSRWVTNFNLEKCSWASRAAVEFVSVFP